MMPTLAAPPPPCPRLDRYEDAVLPEVEYNQPSEGEVDKPLEETKIKPKENKHQDTTTTEAETLNKKIQALEQQLEETKIKLNEQDLSATTVLCDKISHSSFKLQDVALFMPTGKMSDGRRTYLAFHSNCPHRYLSFDSIQGTPDYVLGRIVYQKDGVAQGPLGCETNPFGLHPGTTYWVLTVEIVKVA